ncbi:hypothetical protein AAMO2058_001084800 [Amorphochlora amoebiformis]
MPVPVIKAMSHRILGSAIWRYPGLRSVHWILSRNIPKKRFELSIQGSIGLFMVSSIVFLAGMRRKSMIDSMKRRDLYIKDKLATDPKYAQYVAASNENYQRRLASTPAVFPKKKNQS